MRNCGFRFGMTVSAIRESPYHIRDSQRTWGLQWHSKLLFLQLCGPCLQNKAVTLKFAFICPPRGLLLSIYPCLLAPFLPVDIHFPVPHSRNAQDAATCV